MEVINTEFIFGESLKRYFTVLNSTAGELPIGKYSVVNAVKLINYHVLVSLLYSSSSIFQFILISWFSNFIFHNYISNFYLWQFIPAQLLGIYSHIKCTSQKYMAPSLDYSSCLGSILKMFRNV